MNTLIVISVLPILLLFLGLYKAQKSLLPVTVIGLLAAAARAGVISDEARSELYSPTLPAIDPARDLGVFFTRDRPGEGASAASDVPPASDSSGEAAKEMQRMLEQWGYAHPKAPNSMASPREGE